MSDVPGVGVVDLVARMKPTITRMTNGWLHLDHIILSGEVAPEALVALGGAYEVGVPGVGWFTVQKLRYDEPSLLWIWPVKALVRPVPQHVTLPHYDIGHRVVVTRGEFMGTIAPITDSRVSPKGQIVVLSGGAAHVHGAVGALWDGSVAGLEALTPLPLKYPPGTRVQVRHLGSWHSATVGEWQEFVAQVWLEDLEKLVVVRRDRSLWLDRDESAPRWRAVTPARRVPSRKVPPANGMRRRPPRAF